MESAYVLAEKKLNEIRIHNKATLEYRHSTAVLKVPRISEIESELTKLGTALLRCVLEKSSNFDEIKTKITSFQNEKKQLLIKNGFDEDFLNEIYTCPICRDTGFVGGHRCSCLKNLISKHISANSNLTEFMRKQTFETFDFSLFANDEKALKLARKNCTSSLEFANSFDAKKLNLLIMGNAGTGKTYLSSAVANRALERGKTVYYQTAYSLFDIMEQVRFQKTKDDSLASLADYVYAVDLLIIDDLGTEFVTQFSSSTFFNIINTRILSGKSTLISTNLSLENIDNIYSTRVASRFLGDYTILQTLGNDLRPLIKIKEKNL